MNLKIIYLFLFLNCFVYSAELDVKNKDYIGNTLNLLKNITPEEEFFIGKKQVSQLITDKMYYSKSPRVKYLNQIVNSLILSSDRPYIYDGYKVILVENKSFNAYAFPGGIIVVNDGIFKYLTNEDQVAAILAHEIGHIQEKHNLGSDKSSKTDDALTIASNIAIDKHVDNKYAQVLSIGIFNGLSNSIIKGYNVNQEAEADSLGITLMAKAGYDSIEFLNTLKNLKKITNSYGGSNYPEDRLERLEKMLVTLDYDKEKIISLKEIRTKRYKRYK